MADYMKFANSTVYKVKLLADTPEQFEGKFGMQNNYSCECNGNAVIVSQKIGSGLDQALDSGVAGDVFIIEKRQDPGNPKNFPFHVEKGTKEAVEKAAVHVSSPQATDWDAVNALKDWNIQKALALKGACELSVGLQGEELEESVTPLFHKLFALVRNDASLIVDRINRCVSLAQLDELWASEGSLWVEIIGFNKMASIQKIKAKKAENFPDYKEPEPTPPPAAPDVGDDPLPF